MKRSSPFVTILMASAVMFGSVQFAHAALYNRPLAKNAYIKFGGLEWAWASPEAADGSWDPGTAIDLSYQRAHGWRLPTAAELLRAPVAQNFMFSGANVPLGGTDGVSGSTFNWSTSTLVSAAACAASYFSNRFTGCNWSNAPGSGATGTTGSFPWWGLPGAPLYAESLVVRTSPVPLPAALPLFVGAVAGLGALAKRRRKSASDQA